MIKDTIIFHCSMSDRESHDDIEVIRTWHVRDNGWRDVGYQYFIKADGEVQLGRDENDTGAHALGYNYRSIGICLHGIDKFTKEQYEACASLVDDLMERYPITSIVPHNFVNDEKSCPNFNVINEILRRINRKNPTVIN